MDAGSLPSTWQDALENHSVANARAFEKQLRASTLRDKEKLRTLVGSNYRDFLATAEQIVELTEHTKDAESNIAALSQACKPPSSHYVAHSASSHANTASQLKLLDQMIRSASKAIKQRLVLLASRLVVVSRLLLKHLEQYQDALKATQWLQTRLKAIRQHLMNRIDGILVNPTTPLDGLSQAIVAYCLTTSSSSSDAIKHFQMLRRHKLAQTELKDSKNFSDLDRIKQKCHYLLCSVEGIRALSGRLVTELLNSLQKQPLLEDDALLKTESVQLDMHRDLLPTDILSFTPYFKRVVPTASEVQETVQGWVVDTVKLIIRDIKAYVQDKKLLNVLRTRREVLEILLPCYFSIFMHVSTTFNDVRMVFTERILDLLQQHAKELQTIATDLQINDLSNKEGPLWKSNVVRQTSTVPAHNHLRALQSFHLGTQRNLQYHLRRLRKWARVCTKTRDELNNLVRVRWQDKIEEYDDEDEEAAQEILVSLSKQDPQKFITKFDQDLLDSAERFVVDLSKRATAVTIDNTNENVTDQIGNLLRLIREVQTTLHSVAPSQEFALLATSTRHLQEALARSTASELFNLSEGKDPQATLTFAAEDLPSPLAVSVLQTTASLMSRNGGIDLWTRPAVQKFCAIVLERIVQSEKSRFYVCSELDSKYLAAAFGDNSAEKKSSTDPITRKAAMYWSRTKTLFGVLSV